MVRGLLCCVCVAWLRDRVVVGNIGVVVVEEIAIDTIGVLVENVVGVIG
jgi:hypothetical protein